MNLTWQLILLIIFFIIVAKSGTNSNQQKIDKEIDAKQKKEGEQRILNARIKKQREL